MTAQLVNLITRAPLARMFYAYPRSGDAAIRTDVPGQLWEREAEREPVDHVTTGRFRRTHTMSSPVWAFLPLSPAGWCKFYREMDAQYGTQPSTPLHHDERCPIHAYDGSILYGLTSVDDE